MENGSYNLSSSKVGTLEALDVGSFGGLSLGYVIRVLHERYVGVEILAVIVTGNGDADQAPLGLVEATLADEPPWT